VNDLDRARARYVERDANPELSGFWTLTNPVVVHLMQERERAVLRGLLHTGMRTADVSLLDVGCGRGQEFASYLRLGIPAHQIFGVDLSEHRVENAKAQGVGHVELASGSALPFESNSFDLVVQNVVFSSIIDAVTRQAVATEMLRVLRPGGWLLWYDAGQVASKDPHFRGVPKHEVLSMFPAVRWKWQRITTHLGLLRRIYTVFGERGMRVFDLSGLFKTHLLGWGQKQ
jgi:SAM-dependent methyltransferase